MPEASQGQPTTEQSPTRKILQILSRLFQHFLAEIHGLEQIFIKMQHIYAFVCQLFFFTMAEMSFPDDEIKKDERIISGLTTLLFYSVIAYFLTRIKDLYMKNWNRLNNELSMRNYAYYLCKIIIEWLKAIVIIICLKEQGMKLHLRTITSFLTFSYYICSEKIFVDTIHDFIVYFEYDLFEGLEHLIVPMFLNVYAIAISLFCVLRLCLGTLDGKYGLMASYFLIYLRLKDVIYNYYKVLIVERETYASFRCATEKDILDWDDICAVCLNRMSKARITPCNHLFHPVCLKQCLKSSYQCPLCKCDFIRE